MSLKRKTLHLIAAILAALAVELALGAMGASVAVRAAAGLALVGAIGLAFWREAGRLEAELDAVRQAIDSTAQGDFTSPVEAGGFAETAAVSRSLVEMRDRLGEMGRQLVESLRIESLNMLGSILVHDMKNLSFRLRCLSGNLAGNYDDPEFRESLARTLDDTTDKMDQMVRRFRERKEMVIVKIPVNLNEIVRGALVNLQRDSSGIRFNEQYGELPPVWADAMLIENAVFNIADNARDAMPSGGWLYVRTEIYQDGAGRFAVIDIADTGTGMSQEFVRKDLFAPFVTTKPRGLGLGLYTCRQIVQMHDGRIDVRSAPGRGTIFSIFLPITE